MHLIYKQVCDSILCCHFCKVKNSMTRKPHVIK